MAENWSYVLDDNDSSAFDFDLSTAATNTSNSSEDDFYIYDYDASVNVIPLSELVPVALVYGLTLVLGVTGNALVIFSILRYRRMQSVTNIFLTSLSTADLIVVLICVPIKVGKPMISVAFFNICP